MARRPGAAPGIAGFGDLRAQLVRGVLYLTSEKRIPPPFILITSASGSPQETGPVGFLLSQFRRAAGVSAGVDHTAP